LIAAPRWVPDTKTDWPTDRLTVCSNITFTWLDKRCARGSNWANLFLGDINTETWPYWLWGKRLKWDSNIWLWVRRDSDPRMTANCTSKLQSRPLASKDAPQCEDCKYPTVLKIWSWAVDGCPTPRQTGRLAVDRRITWTRTWTWTLVSSWVNCELILVFFYKESAFFNGVRNLV
jgi:hypothetical protein